MIQEIIVYQSEVMEQFHGNGQMQSPFARCAANDRGLIREVRPQTFARPQCEFRNMTAQQVSTLSADA